MLRVTNVHKSFGETPILNGVSFELVKGGIVGLVGPSGGGKSVLLKILGSIIAPDAGTVEFLGVGKPSAARTGFLFQEGALFDSMTVLENVAFPLSALGEDFAERSEQDYRILSEVGLGDAFRKYPGQLSGGMRRRVGLARALVANPEIVLLDDPTGGLDPVAASIIMNLIKRLHAQSRSTVVLVSHDIRRLLPNVERVLCLFDGKIVADCEPEHLVRMAPDNVVSFLRTRFDFSTFGTEVPVPA